MGQCNGVFQTLKRIFINNGENEIVQFVDEFASFLTFEGKRKFHRRKAIHLENDIYKLHPVISR